MDIWGVGQLIISYENKGVSTALLSLGNQMQSDIMLSAADALELITKYQSSSAELSH